MQFEVHSAIVGRIYDCVDGNDDWAHTLSSIADLCGAENAALATIDSKLGRSSVVSPRSDPDVGSAYETLWWQHDPTAPVATALTAGQSMTLDDVGREVFFASAFYNDFWRFSGLGSDRLSVNLASDGGLLSCLVIQPSKRRDVITDKARQSALLFGNHLSRAVNLASQLERAEAERLLSNRQTASGYAGLFVLGTQGQIFHADDQGEKLLEQGRSLRARFGRIAATDAQASAALLAALNSCGNSAAGTSSNLSLAPDPENPAGPALTLEIVPYKGSMYGRWGTRPKAVLVARFVHEQKAERLNLLRREMGLTLAEATLALEILKGDGRAAAAQRCGISINTARTHLMHIFQKAGVNRQTELIRQLLKVFSGDEPQS